MSRSRHAHRLLLVVTLLVAAAPSARAGRQPDKSKPRPVPAAPAPAPAAPAAPTPATPAPTPTPVNPDDKGDAADAVDVTALRQEYLALRDQLFRSRARAAAVASELYSTKLRLDLTYTSARFYSISRATIRLDGANVFDDTDGVIGKDAAPRFESYVAPGRHVISVRVEAVGKDDERFTSIIDNTFTIQAPAGKDVIVSAKAHDGGDIPYAWSRDEEGSYSLVLDVKVDTSKRPGAAAPKTAAAAGKAGDVATR